MAVQGLASAELNSDAQEAGNYHDDDDDADDVENVHDVTRWRQRRFR